MIKLSSWLTVSFVVLLTVGGVGCALAAETSSAPPTQEEASLTQADLDAKKAEIQMQYAQATLEAVQRKHQAGVATEEELRAAERDAHVARLVLKTAQLAAGTERTRKVSIEVEGASLETALRMLFKDTPYSYVVNPAVGNIQLEPLTIHAKNVDLDAVLQAVCETYDLDLKLEKGQVYYFTPRADVVTVGGRRVPLIGAFSTQEGERVVWKEKVPLPSTAPSTAEPQGTIKFPGSMALVDLEVVDAPIAEVAAQLSAMVNAELDRETERNMHAEIQACRAEAARRASLEREMVGRRGGTFIHGGPFTVQENRNKVEFIAHDSLKDVRVTAKVYRWPAGEVLQMLIDQADLVCTEEAEQTMLAPSTVPSVEGSDPIEIQHTSYVTRIYLVPRPRLSIVGRNVSGVGGFGSGGLVHGLGDGDG